MKKISNGSRKVANKKRKSTKRRKNSVTAKPRTATVRAAAPVANKVHKRKRRRNTAIAKVANKRRVKRHKRRNGFLGNSKETGMKVLQLGGGVVLTKMFGGVIGRFTNSTLNGFGLGQFAMAINEGLTAVALSIIGGYAGKQFGFKDLGGDMLLGGLVVAGIDGANAALPNSPFGIFSQANTPVFLAGAAAGAQAAVNEVAQNGLQATAAKVGGLTGNNAPMMSNVRSMQRPNPRGVFANAGFNQN